MSRLRYKVLVGNSRNWLDTTSVRSRQLLKIIFFYVPGSQGLEKWRYEYIRRARLKKVEGFLKMRFYWCCPNMLKTSTQSSQLPWQVNWEQNQDKNNNKMPINNTFTKFGSTKAARLMHTLGWAQISLQFKAKNSSRSGCNNKYKVL